MVEAELDHVVGIEPVVSGVPAFRVERELLGEGLEDGGVPRPAAVVLAEARRWVRQTGPVEQLAVVEHDRGIDAEGEGGDLVAVAPHVDLGGVVLVEFEVVEELGEVEELALEPAAAEDADRPDEVGRVAFGDARSEDCVGLVGVDEGDLEVDLVLALVEVLDDGFLAGELLGLRAGTQPDEPLDRHGLRARRRPGGSAVDTGARREGQGEE